MNRFRASFRSPHSPPVPSPSRWRRGRVRHAAVSFGAVFATACALVVAVPGSASATAGTCRVNSTDETSETIEGTSGDDQITCRPGVLPGTTADGGAGGVGNNGNIRSPLLSVLVNRVTVTDGSPGS